MSKPPAAAAALGRHSYFTSPVLRSPDLGWMIRPWPIHGVRPEVGHASSGSGIGVKKQSLEEEIFDV